jgi:S1-C subfamily serine protease
MTRWIPALLALLCCLPACAPDYPDDRFVHAVRGLKPAVVLLTMRVPPERKSDGYDEAYATGVVVASGAWGSDILTVAHAVDGAWDLHATLDNVRRIPVHLVAINDDVDVALVRSPVKYLPVVHLLPGGRLEHEIGRDVGLLGYPIPDEFEDEQLGPGTSLDSGRLSSIRKGAIEVTLQIVPGESGGPIFLADTGRVIGIAESRFDDERSIGFGLPIDAALTFLHKHDATHGF